MRAHAGYRRCSRSFRHRRGCRGHRGCRGGPWVAIRRGGRTAPTFGGPGRRDGALASVLLCSPARLALACLRRRPLPDWAAPWRPGWSGAWRACADGRLRRASARAPRSSLPTSRIALPRPGGLRRRRGRRVRSCAAARSLDMTAGMRIADPRDVLSAHSVPDSLSPKYDLEFRAEEPDALLYPQASRVHNILHETRDSRGTLCSWHTVHVVYVFMCICGTRHMKII